MADVSTDQITALDELLRPLLWTADFRPYVGNGLLTTEIRGDVRLTDADLATWPTSAAEGREFLFRRAQAAITAVEAAGYGHRDGPLIEISGAATNHEPLRCRVEMSLWLR